MNHGVPGLPVHHQLEAYVIIKKSLKKSQYLKIEKISLIILYLSKEVDIIKQKDLVHKTLTLVLINYASRWDTYKNGI